MQANRPRPIKTTSHACLVCSALLFFQFCLPSFAKAAWYDSLIDPNDGYLDASHWLLERKGALPVPIVITEPAVGYGGGLGLMFFHRKNRDDYANSGDPLQPRQFTPPSVSGIFAAATENGTKMAALAHLGIWRDDTVRYTGGVLAMQINLNFYGGGRFPTVDNGISYSLKGWATFQQLMWKLGNSHFRLGPQLTYYDGTASLDQPNAPPIFNQLNGDSTAIGAGGKFSYDSRDNIFTPSTGVQSDWTIRENWGSFNGDYEYTAVEGKNRWYVHPTRHWVVGLRLDAEFVSDAAPFYARPFINQRGIAKARYQGDAIIDTEFETRYAFNARWYAVAFGGAARAAESFGDLGSAENRFAGGLGFRYLLAQMLGLQVGLDAARGPTEWAFYIQIGHGWSF